MIFETIRRWNQSASVPVRDLGWAVRLGFFTVTVMIAFITFWLAMCVPLFTTIYGDVLGGKPLPALTVFVMARPMAWLVSVFAIPAVALVFALFAKRHVIAVFGISLASLVLLVESFWIGFGVFLPFVSYPTGMQAVL